MRVKEIELDDDYIELSQYDSEESEEEISEEKGNKIEKEDEKKNEGNKDDKKELDQVNKQEQDREQEDEDDDKLYVNGENTSASISRPTDGLVVGAAAVGALAGLVLLGPRAGVLTGLGLGAAAMTSGAIGDTARSVGEVGVEAGKRAKELDEDHQIVENTKVAANDVWEKAKEMDEKHHLIEKTKETAIAAYHGAVNFEKKHNIIDNVARSIAKGATALTEMLTKDDSSDNPTSSYTADKSEYPGVRNISGPPLEIDSAIERLMAMGFDRKAVVIAIQESNNNLEVAASMLLGD